MIQGQIHHFSPYGLLDGMVVLVDQETGSLWNHMTGQAIEGPLKGHTLEAWPVHFTTVRAALVDHPDIEISISSDYSIRKWLAQTLYPGSFHARVLFQLFLHWMMRTKPDPRLPELTRGLGVVFEGRAKYYPLSAIPANGLVDCWLNRNLRLQTGKIDGTLHAIWSDTNEKPMQLVTRWYGFALTYPDCEIYKE